jgi:YVTN family beta-propeller protein
MGLEYNPQDNKVYCANEMSNTVSVIGGTSNQVIRTLTTGDYPVSFAYNPVDNKVFCAVEGAGNINVIDGASDSMLEHIFVGEAPTNAVCEPAHDRVYVANTWSHDIAVIRDSALGIEDRPAHAAQPGRLDVRPNPFRTQTAISYQLAANSPALVSVSDATGRRVRTFDQSSIANRQSSIAWDGTDDSGRSLPSGIYFVTLTADGFSTSQKLVMEK